MSYTQVNDLNDLHSFLTQIKALDAELPLQKVHLNPNPETLNLLGGLVTHARSPHRPCPDAFLRLPLSCLDWGDISKILNHLFSTPPKVSALVLTSRQRACQQPAIDLSGQ